MIIAILCFLFGVAAISAAGNENWGAMWVAIGIIVVVVFMKHCIMQDAKAYGNWVDYWAEGGPEKDRRRR